MNLSRPLRLLAVATSILLGGGTTFAADPAPAAQAASLPVVRLIATGGTIAMKIDPVTKAPVTKALGGLSDQQIMDIVAYLQALK